MDKVAPFYKAGFSSHLYVLAQEDLNVLRAFSLLADSLRESM